MPLCSQTRPDGTMRLADGRRLGFAVYGDPHGWPLFFFHGTPGSRLLARFAAPAAQALAICLLAPERPGYGLSDPHPNRRLLDWPEDIRQLADALTLEKFGVVGVSGGGPYAAACAWRLSERIEVAGLISSLAPKDAVAPELPIFQRLLARLVARTRLTGPCLELLSHACRRHPHRLLAALIPLIPGPDRALLSRPEVRRLQVDGLVQACRQGAAATAQDLAIFSQPWGFRVEDITVPVHLWHGQQDRVVPVAMGRYLAAHIPGCRARFIAGAGHLWIFEGYKEVIATLRASASAGHGKNPPASAAVGGNPNLRGVAKPDASGGIGGGLQAKR